MVGEKGNAASTGVDGSARAPGAAFMRASSLRIALLAGTAALLIGDVASAQQLQQPLPPRGTQPEDIEVIKRPRPEYDPVGIRQGPVFYYPAIGLSEFYDDNILATETNTESDFITVVSPSLTVRSDWPDYAFNASLKGDFGFYADNNDENFADLAAAAGGRYDFSRSDSLEANLGIARLHEERSSPDDANGTEPTEYYRADAGLGYTHRFNRLAVKGELIGRRLMFDDVSTVGGEIDQSDRDRYETEEAVRLSYEVSPSLAVFTRGALRQWRYDDERDRSGFERDADGYRVDVGASWDTGLIVLEGRIGYLSWDFDDGRLETVDGPTAGLLATWQVTGLTTLRARIDREVEPTTLSGASGRFDTRTALEVDHELLRNLILSGQLAYTRSEFEGINRDDDLYRLGLSARYLIDQGFWVSAGYAYDDRSSNAANADFDRNLVFVRLNYGL